MITILKEKIIFHFIIRLLHSVVFLLLVTAQFSCINEKFNEENLTVKKVVDGDTFWIDNGSSKGLKIRLIGVDAPESRKTGRKEIGYYGKEAKEFLTNLLKDKKVRLEYDVDKTDQYGRTLAYAYLEDGTFINAELIKQGYAMVMTIPPNVKFVDSFVEFQKEARENRRGLWAKNSY